MPKLWGIQNQRRIQLLYMFGMWTQVERRMKDRRVEKKQTEANETCFSATPASMDVVFYMRDNETAQNLEIARLTDSGEFFIIVDSKKVNLEHLVKTLMSLVEILRKSFGCSKPKI